MKKQIDDAFERSGTGIEPTDEIGKILEKQFRPEHLKRMGVTISKGGK